MDGRSFMLQEHYRVISYNIKKPFGQDRTAMESNDTAAGMPYMAYIRHKKEYVNIPPQGLLMSELSDIIKASYQ